MALILTSPEDERTMNAAEACDVLSSFARAKYPLPLLLREAERILMAEAGGFSRSRERLLGFDAFGGLWGIFEVLLGLGVSTEPATHPEFRFGPETLVVNSQFGFGQCTQTISRWLFFSETLGSPKTRGTLKKQMAHVGEIWDSPNVSPNDPGTFSCSNLFAARLLRIIFWETSFDHMAFLDDWGRYVTIQRVHIAFPKIYV